MRKLLLLLFITLLYFSSFAQKPKESESAHSVKGRDSMVVLDTAMFDKYFQVISLSKQKGWIFKRGNDTNWSKSEIDTTGWIKLTPATLTGENADKSGKLEGWLRIRFKLDSSFKNIKIGIQALRWAATDIYIDGNYITSFGNTGLNGKPYEENRNLGTVTRPLQIETGKEHMLAVHIVDHVAPLNHRFLKTESLDNVSDSLIRITGPLAYEKFTGYIRDTNGYGFLYCGVIGFLGVLFWFLYLQNRREKSLLFISISTSFFFTWIFLVVIAYYPFDIDFDHWWLIFFIAVQFWPLAIVSMIYTMGEIFHFKHKKALLIFGILYVSFSILSFYFGLSSIPENGLIVTIIALYIPISLRKRLKGAQWAIVAGVMSTVIFSFTWAYLATSYYKSFVFPYVHLYQTGECLSFPASLMIYVAMRFKEILTEVQVNAKQVVQLSEEKKEQAVKQQKMLEEEVARQTIELRTSLENLKSTQAQLIQSEKMASLGELTAGIAHEIQNPLNFVNNFSEVNTELIAELESELEKGDLEEAKSITGDLKENEQKINLHGKRADAIVKGMLQHSRQSSGQKEPIAINSLADEYLRLAYHGLRAKDKSFNATMHTDFDQNAGDIKIIGQDIGRVLLNLYNNAFYAVTEKKAHTGDGYEPTVSVSTKKKDNAVVLTVTDNGAGIPRQIVDKIFQPFFTTKPTGQGTGLGLSLSYDIIKAHGGEITVETKDGDGAEFIIRIPCG